MNHTEAASFHAVSAPATSEDIEDQSVAGSSRCTSSQSSHVTGHVIDRTLDSVPPPKPPVKLSLSLRRDSVSFTNANEDLHGDTSFASEVPPNMRKLSERVLKKSPSKVGSGSAQFFRKLKYGTRRFWTRLSSVNWPHRRARNVLPQYRTVLPNHLLADGDVPNPNYAGNKIKTTKYTIFTFLPKNLFEQFHRFANLYFIAVVLLNWVPAIEAFGKELAMLPVLFVLSVTAIKDIFEDRRRYSSDKKINRANCRVYDAKLDRYVKTQWKALRVGDFVHLSCNEIIPADLLLLRSSDPLGICHVETSNLDGESNLKQRQVITKLADKGNLFHPHKFKSTVECEQPNNQIYKFNGFLLHPSGERESVNKNNLLLRGCELRNTDFIEGLVLYAGHETKAMLNNSGPRYKRSKLERIMNWDIVWCVVILLVLCVVGSIGSGLWLNSYAEPTEILFLTFFGHDGEVQPTLEAFIVFWSYIIILQVFVPISLYVSLEVVKLGQIYFITQDKHLYHAKSGKRIQCRALNIPEELGQVEYVMSDKTGTLTENLMIFRRCAVTGVDYSPDANGEPASFPSSTPTHETAKDVVANPELQRILFALTEDLHQRAAQGGGESWRKTAMLDFFVNLALCNTVVVSAHPHHDEMTASGYLLDNQKENGPRSQTPSSTNTNATLLSANDYRLSANGSVSLRPHSNELATTIESHHFPPIANGSHQNHRFSASDNNRLSLISNGRTSSLSHIAPVGGEEIPSRFLPSHDNAYLAELSGGTEIGAAGMRTSKSVPSIIMEEPSRSAEHSDNESGRCTPGSIVAETAEPAGSPVHMRPNALTVARKFLNSSAAIGRKLLPPLRGSKRSQATPSPSPGFLNPYYEAESPDELALVYAAAAYGVRLIKRQLNYVSLELPDGRRERYTLLQVLPFDSVRKRMSVIVRQPNTNRIVLFCKGADNVIMDLLSVDFQRSKRGNNCVIKSQEYLNLYAGFGLRTLCLARRYLSETEYENWAAEHQEAELSLDDREQLIYESACKIEGNLELLGITGIEDRLQDGVAECIANLRRAGIKVWVLTGDKIETAVNIAYACRLFHYGMELIQLGASNEEDADALLQHHIDGLDRRNRRNRFAGLTLVGEDGPGTGLGLGLIVDGRTLALCLHPRLEDKFVYLISKCASVLCCRATPLQKAAVARLVKEKLHALVLGIGDGANDVSLIQCADIGIGISGQEGMQAVMASDFAMARFRFLERLLLVHGHWCYDRLARMVLYFFYKNAMFVFTLFWFQVFNGWSAQVMIDPLYLMFYNLIFTSLPPLLLGIFDQDACDDILLDQPQLYAQGSEGTLYRTYSFWLNVLDAFWQSAVLFFVPYFLYHGTDVDLWQFGTLVTCALVLCNQLHLAVEVKSWTLPMAGSILLSVAVFFAFALTYNALAVSCCASNPPYMVTESLLASPIYWATMALMIILALLPRFTYRVFANTIDPNLVLLARMQKREREAQLPKAPSNRGLSVAFSKRKPSKKVSVTVEQNGAANGIHPVITPTGISANQERAGVAT